MRSASASPRPTASASRRTAGSCARGARRCRRRAARRRGARRRTTSSWVWRSSAVRSRDRALQLALVGRAPAAPARLERVAGDDGPQRAERERRRAAPTTATTTPCVERELRAPARRSPPASSAPAIVSAGRATQAQQRHGERQQRRSRAARAQGGASRSGLPCMRGPDRVGLDLGARHRLVAARRGRVHGPAGSARSSRRRRPCRAAARGGTRPATRSANDTVGNVPGPPRKSIHASPPSNADAGSVAAGGTPGGDDRDAVQPLDRAPGSGG